MNKTKKWSIVLLMAITVASLSMVTVPEVSGADSAHTISVNPVKFIQGKVTYKETGKPVTVADVSANKRGEPGWANTRVKSDGTYLLGVSGSTWEVMINPPWDPETNQQMSVDWAYINPPQTISFKDDETREVKTINFTVTKATAAVEGKVVYPNGTPVTRGGVDIRGPEGQGNGGGLSDKGTFKVQVPPGKYGFSVRLEEPLYSAPKIEPFTLTDGQTKNLGTIKLVKKNEFIKGKVTDKNGKGIGGIRINAWSPDVWGGFGETTSAGDGTYTLAVVPGTWEVMPQPGPESDYAYEAGPPSRVTVSKNQTVTGVNFQLVLADATITGRVVDSKGNILTELFGFANAMRGKEGEPPMPGPGSEIINGRFTIKVPHGTYRVSVHMPPDSEYSAMSSKEITLAKGETKSVSVLVKKNDAVIKGKIVNENGKTITGIKAEVFAHNPQGSFKHAFVKSDGTYILNVVGGSSWFMGVHVSSEENYIGIPPDNNKVTIKSGQTVSKNFTLLAADATISGKVLDPSGKGLANVFVFADSKAAEETKTPGPGIHAGEMTRSDGTFRIKVPAGTFGVGSGAPSSLGYISPEIQKVTIKSKETVKGVTLRYRKSDAAISGSVTLDGKKHRAFVWAWSEKGGHSEIMSFDGTYTLNVTKGDIWHIGADFETTGKFYRSDEHVINLTGSTASQDLVLTEAPFTLPSPVSHTYDASKMTTITLEDGMTITIPAGAIKTSGNITVLVTPKAELAKQRTSRPIAFGYDIKALDANGNVITSKFNADVTIVIPYTEEMLEDMEITEDDLKAAFWDETSSLWQGVTGFIIDKDNDTVTITVSHFTSFSTVTSGVISAVKQKQLLTMPFGDGSPHLRAFDSEGNLLDGFKSPLFAYTESLRGGYEAIGADIDGDGTDEIIVVPGDGFGAHVRAYTNEGELLTHFFAYDKGFRGGLEVAAGDIDGDGVEEIVISPKGKGGPNIRVYGYKDGEFELIDWFFAYDTYFRGGVNIVLGDVNGDGKEEIVTSPKGDGGPNVRIYYFNGTKFELLDWFFAYDKYFRGGVNIALGDVNGDGKADIVTAPDGQGGPNVRCYYFDGTSFKLLDWLFAYDKNFRGGVNIALGDLNGDGKAEIVTAPMGDGGPNVRTYDFDGKNLRLLDWFFAYDQAFRGGVNIALGDIDGDGKADIVTAPRGDGGPNVRLYKLEGGKSSLIAWFWAYAKEFRGGVNLGKAGLR